VIETRYPLRVERHELLPEVGGSGRHLGGPGVALDFRILEPGIQMQYTVETTIDPLAKGLDGGDDGAPGVLVLNPGTDREIVMTDRVTAYGLARGRRSAQHSLGRWWRPRHAVMQERYDLEALRIERLARLQEAMRRRREAWRSDRDHV
jgi:N-methylhydantoinase B